MLTGKQEPEYLAFLNEQTGLSMTKEEVKTITRLDEETNNVLGVVGFTMLDKSTVEIIVAVKQGKRLTKALVKATVSYAFKQIGAEKMVAYVPKDKEQKVEHLCKKFGMDFKKAEMAKNLTTGERIEHVYELSRGDCKWLTI